MIAITGFSGFVGKHLVDSLQQEKLLLLGKSNVADASHFIELDLANIDETSVLSALQNVTTLIHLAALTNALKGTFDEQSSLFSQINVQATATLASLAARAGVKRFIFMSSIKVHGETTEEYAYFNHQSGLNPQDLYAKSKVDAEAKLIEITKSYEMEFVIIRPPLVYGKGVKANFNSLINITQKRIPLPLRSINNARSLISVYNLCDLLKICIQHPNAANQIFLVSDDEDLSTSELLEMLCKVQKRPNLAFHFPVGGLKALGNLLNKQKQMQSILSSLCIDITHTKETLGWHPPFTVEHGLIQSCKQPESTDKHL